MRVLQTLALPLGYVTKQEKEQAVAPFSFMERATRISPKRRLRRIQRGEIEEAAGELPATAGKATIAATVSADGARKMKWSGRRGSNSLPPPWQGGALPDELRPQMVPPVGVEPTTRGFSIRCSTN